MRAAITALLARYGILTTNLVITGLIVGVSALITLMVVTLLDAPLFPDLYIAVVTPALLAPSVIYMFAKIVKELEITGNDLRARESRLSDELRARKRAEFALDHASDAAMWLDSEGHVVYGLGFVLEVVFGLYYVEHMIRTIRYFNYGLYHIYHLYFIYT